MEYQKEHIVAIKENPELLKEQRYQQIIYSLMNALNDGNLQRNIDTESLIDILTLSILVRTYNAFLIPVESTITALKVRKLPNSFVRFGAHISSGVVLMPFSFVNMGAYVGERSMIDGGARIGSGAYIGNSVHISGGVGIGGVLEPKQARPVIIENGCFIGANSSISEGVRVGEGTIIGAGSIITASTRIYDSRQGVAVQLQKGSIPAHVTVVPSSYRANSGLYRPCVEIIRDNAADKESLINDSLRT